MYQTQTHPASLYHSCMLTDTSLAVNSRVMFYKYDALFFFQTYFHERNRYNNVLCKYKPVIRLFDELVRHQTNHRGCCYLHASAHAQDSDCKHEGGAGLADHVKTSRPMPTSASAHPELIYSVQLFVRIYICLLSGSSAIQLDCYIRNILQTSQQRMVFSVWDICIYFI